MSSTIQVLCVDWRETNILDYRKADKDTENHKNRLFDKIAFNNVQLQYVMDYSVQ